MYECTMFRKKGIKENNAEKGCIRLWMFRKKVIKENNVEKGCMNVQEERQKGE